jgi:hypothetical protein
MIRSLISASLLFFSLSVKASVIAVDSVSLSTIAGSFQGITMASAVFVNGSITLGGPGGYVTSDSSVNASAFFGGGGQLSGVWLPASNQTSSGANEFTSSFTVESGGRQIILSTSSTVNNFSISSTGVLSFFPELHNSSSTIIPTAATTNHALGGCISGSTLTITTAGGRVQLDLAGTTGQTGNADPVINFLQDGQFVNNLSALAAITGGSPDSIAAPLSYIVDAPTPGQHSYCISLATLNNAGTALLFNDSARTNLFYIKEIK